MNMNMNNMKMIINTNMNMKMKMKMKMIMIIHVGVCMYMKQTMLRTQHSELVQVKGERYRRGSLLYASDDQQW